MKKEDLIDTELKIIDKPVGLGMRNPIYGKIIQTLKVMSNEKCIEIPLRDVNKCFRPRLQYHAKRQNLDFEVAVTKDSNNWLIWKRDAFPRPKEEK